MAKRFGPIRHSERAAFKQCPRKLYWSRVAGIQRRERGKYFAIGSAFHKGLEVWRSGEDISDAMDEACEYLGDNLGATGPELEDESARVRAYLMGYAVRYADDLAYDWKFEHEIKKSQNKGTIDAWMRDDSGAVWIVDDKTRSQLTKDLHLVVQLDEQLFNYALLLMESGISPVAGAVIRETKKAGIKRTKKESSDDYAERVMALYKDGNDALFVEEKVMFKPETLKRYTEMRLFENNRIKSNCSKNASVEDWPYNYSSCIGKYGNCEFLEACTGAGNDKLYEPTEQEALDNGEGRKKIFGYATEASGEREPTETTGGLRDRDVSSAPI